jgi:ankyrin repeat protein
MTPLLIACKQGHIRTVRSLLEYHASASAFDVSARCRGWHWDSPATAAADRRLSLVQLYGRSALHWAALSGSVPVLELLMTTPAAAFVNVSDVRRCCGLCSVPPAVCTTVAITAATMDATHEHHVHTLRRGW